MGPFSTRYPLDGDEARTLLLVAREAVDAWVRRQERLDLTGYALTARLLERHGAFVTLRAGDALRGCVGILSNRYPLVEAVRESAISSATQDGRFDPLGAEELDGLRIEISALHAGAEPETPFYPVAHAEEIRIGRDGVYVRDARGNSGVLLPQVARDRGWSVQEFLDAVCVKAGLSPLSWKDPATAVFRFSAQVIVDAR